MRSTICGKAKWTGRCRPKENSMENTELPKSENHIVLLILFWAYVLIPLGWGVLETFKKALILFQ